MIDLERIQEAQQITLGGGVDDLVDAWKRERILGAGLVEVGEVDTHALLPAFLRHNNGVFQPLGVPNFANGTRRL